MILLRYIAAGTLWAHQDCGSPTEGLYQPFQKKPDDGLGPEVQRPPDQIGYYRRYGQRAQSFEEATRGTGRGTNGGEQVADRNDLLLGVPVLVPLRTAAVHSTALGRGNAGDSLLLGFDNCRAYGSELSRVRGSAAWAERTARESLPGGVLEEWSRLLAAAPPDTAEVS